MVGRRSDTDVEVEASGLVQATLYEQANASKVMSEAESGLAVLTNARFSEALADLEELTFYCEDFHPYLSLGAGWMTYQAIMSM